MPLEPRIDQVIDEIIRYCAEEGSMRYGSTSNAILAIADGLEWAGEIMERLDRMYGQRQGFEWAEVADRLREKSVHIKYGTHLT